ncbi:hypothetical protein CCB80_05635 [Armatimonadetes bacterium Uphvl-Ar1]|nr:hypothetical protein CCB80_05635 [Armatimonadetes bacterium Uphvl-Ar1]
MGNMSHIIESIQATDLGVAVEGGAKFYAESANGAVRSIGSRSGEVALFGSGVYATESFNVRPARTKSNSEAELQGLWLSETGDLLFAATSVDLVAISTSTKTLAWQFAQKRQWGFLPSIPQGAVLHENDVLMVFYSSGEVVALDRKSRVIESETHSESVRSVVTSGSVGFATDGHTIWKFHVAEGFGSRSKFAFVHNYEIALSGNAEKLFVRIPNRVLIFDARTGEIDRECETGPGLPQMAVDFDGTQWSHLTAGGLDVRGMDGSVLGSIQSEEFPISVHRSYAMESFIIGMRSGSVYSVPWNQ